MAPAAQQNPEVLVGSTVADSYVLDRLIGQGKHGALFDGRHVRTGSRTAVRIIWCDPARRSAVEQALVAQASLCHPHLCAPREIRLLPDQGLLVATPFLPGQDLGQRVAARGKLSVNEGQVVLRQVSAALHALHQQGISHGGLSSGNLYFVRYDDVAVDSAISDSKGAQQVLLLDGGLAVLDGPPVSPADDLRAFGRLMMSVMVDLSAAQRQVLERTQELKPESRFTGVAAFWRVWSDASGGGGRPGRAAATSVMPKFVLGQPDPEAPGSRRYIILAAALLGLLVVGLVILLYPRQPLPPAPPPAAASVTPLPAPPAAVAKHSAPAEPAEPASESPSAKKRKRPAKRSR